MNKIIPLLVVLALFTVAAYSQKTCTSNPTKISSNINFGSIVWTPSGGATVGECNNMADGLITFVGNVIVDLANNRKITITNNVEIDGSFPISGGPGSTLSVSGGFTLHVTGDLGDAGNNGVQYRVVTATDRIIVDGTLFGKNNNAFTGNGSISGGTLNVKNGSTCGSPCPVAGGFNSCTSGDSFCIDNGALPVSLLFFKAKLSGSNVLLSWATASELNFDYFAVERSTNGFTFSEITRVTGHGTTAERNDYAYIDNTPPTGSIYYRLKSVDFDGFTEYFNIEKVNVSLQKHFIIYPNPVSGNGIKLQSNFIGDQRIHVLVTDATGVQVLDFSFFPNAQEIEIPLSLNPGVYLFQLNGGEYTEVKRVVVP